MYNDKILKMIEDGGSDFQHDVAASFEKLGWKAQIAPYYQDVLTEKSREIDVIARKNIKVTDNFFNNRSEEIVVRIFAECKYIKNDTLFNFVEKNMMHAEKLAKDNDILRHEEYVDLSKLHYVSGNTVAKTWKCDGKDDIYDAWQQSVHSMIYFQNNQHDGRCVVDYPIVVLKSFDNVYMRVRDTEKPYIKIDNNFQLEVDYSYSIKGKNVSKTFLIDVVSFDRLEDFLKLIEADLNIAKNVLTRQIFNQEREANHRQRRNDDFDPHSIFN
jgi:hypothetical protein